MTSQIEKAKENMDGKEVRNRKRLVLRHVTRLRKVQVAYCLKCWRGWWVDLANLKGLDWDHLAEVVGHVQESPDCAGHFYVQAEPVLARQDAPGGASGMVEAPMIPPPGMEGQWQGKVVGKLSPSAALRYPPTDPGLQSFRPGAEQGGW